MRNIFIFIGILITFYGCDSHIFHQYKSVPNGEWNTNESVNFTIESADSISKNNIYICLRNDNNYPFSTIFLISKMVFPSGKQIVDTLQYEMANEKGEWLGSGFSSIKESKLFYKENVIFPQKGTYKFSVKQVTRGINDIESVQPLKGILDVGLQIEKIN